MTFGPVKRGGLLLVCFCLARCASESPAEPDSDGDGRADRVDCDVASAAHWDDCGRCIDADGDQHGEGCNLGPDCDDGPTFGAFCDSGCFSAKRDTDFDGHVELGGEVLSICAFASGYSGADAPEDCDDTDGRHWSDCGACTDTDDDGFGAGCDYGGDCDEANPNVWRNCAGCRDRDHDGAFVGCDAYTTVAQDCDERDPLVHPGAIDFPDNARAEDCEGSSEPNALNGTGIYVSADCGGNGQGTLAAPFCTLAEALAISSPGASIFVAAGTYTMPDTVSSVRIFGGYQQGWFLRSPSRTATTFTNDGTGVVFDDVLIQNAAYVHSNDCEGCSALTIGEGGARLADFEVAMASAATDCTSIQVSGGEAVLVRALVQGAPCTNHRALAQADEQTVVWKSELRGGAPGNVTQQPTVIVGGGRVLVGESSLAADGAHATAIATVTGAVVELHAVRVSVAGDAGESTGIAHGGAALRIVNSVLEVASTSGTAIPLALTHGTAAIFHTELLATGASATAARIDTTDAVRLSNDAFTASGGTTSYGLVISGAGTRVTVSTNDFLVSGAGTTCGLLVASVCNAPVGVDGNIQSSGCSVPPSATCTRRGAGAPLVDELIPPVDIDYALRDGWDIGAYELP